MAKIHDLFIVELAEVIKGYGNDPDIKDPFRLSEFYRFYELPNIAVSRENFEKMRPIEPERKTGKWLRTGHYLDRHGDKVEILRCSLCNFKHDYVVGDTSHGNDGWFEFCPSCGSRNENAKMMEEGGRE